MLSKSNSTVQLSKDLKVDLLGHFIYQSGREKVFLTSMEFKLLTIFISNPNELLDVTYLMNTMNELNDSCYSEQNIYIQISRLRSKIEENPSEPDLLITLRPGYILNIKI